MRRYEEIAADLQERIETGEYPAGSHLPSYRELGEMYDTGQTTIRSALGVLQAAGLVRSVQRGGTVVRERPERRRIPRGRLVRRDPARGYIMPATNRADEPWHAHGRPRAATIPIPPAVAEILGVAGWSDVLRRRRVTSPVGEPPFQLVDTWIHPSGIADAPQCAEPDTGPGGYLDRLEDAGHGPIRWTETTQVRAPTREEANLLGIAESLWIYELVRVGTSARTDQPIEVTVCVIPSDRVAFVSELQRDASATWPTTPVQRP